MGLYKLLPESIKKFLNKKLRNPTNIYQNVHTKIKIEDYHSGLFDKYQNKFSSSDGHLNFDTNITRFRNYMNCVFAEYSIRNNTSGNFLSVGVSYGTSLKVLTHLLDEKVKNIKYFLIDNYKNVGNAYYNTDIKNVKKDLEDIKNFEFVYLEELLTESSLDKVEGNLIYTHLNTGNFEVEFEFLPRIFNKTKSNGVVIVDNYGFWHKNQQEKMSEYISKNEKLFKIVLPSLQCVIIKF